jgi:hypothetical protein
MARWAMLMMSVNCHTDRLVRRAGQHKYVLYSCHSKRRSGFFKGIAWLPDLVNFLLRENDKRVIRFVYVPASR